MKLNTSILALLSMAAFTGCNGLRDLDSTSSAAAPEVCDIASAPFGGGDGSAAKPFLICTVTQLQQVSTDVTKSYKLKADLDLTAVSFTPLGTYTTGFSGTFDGDSHTISNWTYVTANQADSGATIEGNPAHVDYAAGFFRTLESGALVENLTLSNVSFNGRFYTGIVTGLMKTGATISNVHASTLDQTVAHATNLGVTTGMIIGYNDHPTGGTSGITGGLVGQAQTGTTITQSSFAGLIRGGNLVGGLVGDTRATISYCHTSGAIMGRDGNNGGFAGNESAGGVISNSYSTATVTETSGNSGGFIGSVNAGGIVTTSYFNGSMTGNALGTGGFGGYIGGAGAKISKCYSAGTVVGNSYTGGFMGWGANVGGIIEDSYSISTVNGPSWTGGFMGVLGNQNTATLNRVYSAGTVVSTTPADAGTLLGYAGATAIVTNSFADINTNANGFIGSTIAGATVTASSSQTTPNMKTAATFTGAGWDFTTVWQIDPAVNNGYPTLR